VHHNHLKVLNTDGYDAEWQAVNGWLERCITFCRKLGVGFAVAVVPNRSQLGLRTSRKRYQHRLEQLTLPLGIYLIDPDERFLSHRREPLFLFADDHFAPAGHALFAQVLTDHIMVWAGSK
jgi:hypothetical protein